VALEVVAQLPQDLTAGEVSRLILEGYSDSDLSCRYGRDPYGAEDFPSRAPATYAFLEPNEETTVMFPPYEQVVVVVRALSESAEIARACVSVDFAHEPDSVEVLLRHLNQQCGDGRRDVREQCDNGGEAGEGGGSDTDIGFWSHCAQCRALPVDVESPSDGSCMQQATMACTDERCLVGWIRNHYGNYSVSVKVRHLNGLEDTEGSRGSEGEGTNVRQLRMVACGDSVGAFWLEDGPALRGMVYNSIGQKDSEQYVLDRDDLLSSAGGEPVEVQSIVAYCSGQAGTSFAAGWLDSAGRLVVRDLSDDEQQQWSFEADFAEPPVISARGRTVAIAWHEEDYASPEGGQTFPNVAWGMLGDLSSTEAGAPFWLVPDLSFRRQGQTSPAVAVTSHSSYVAYAWTDANNNQDDESGLGIRGAFFYTYSDSPDETSAVNTTYPGRQEWPALAAGPGYVVAGWLHGGTGEANDPPSIRSRYLTNSGGRLGAGFVADVRDYYNDFEVARFRTLLASPPVIHVHHGAYYLWLEGQRSECANRLRLVRLPGAVASEL
jgi:hypothetical protein